MPLPNLPHCGRLGRGSQIQQQMLILQSYSIPSLPIPAIVRPRPLRLSACPALREVGEGQPKSTPNPILGYKFFFQFHDSCDSLAPPTRLSACLAMLEVGEGQPKSTPNPILPSLPIPAIVWPRPLRGRGWGGAYKSLAPPILGRGWGGGRGAQTLRRLPDNQIRLQHLGNGLEVFNARLDTL